MSEDGITSYGIGGFIRPLRPEALRKEARRLKRRAERLLHKAEVAEKCGKRARRDELLDQADECFHQAQQLS